MAEGILFNIQRFSLHDGPGIRTVVFLKGCPLRCRWCANPESQSAVPETAEDGTVYGERAGDEAVWAKAERDIPFYEESGGGLTLSGGEPLMQAAFSEALLKRAKAASIHTAVETSGAVPWANLERLMPLVDLWLFDVKHHDAEIHRQGTGEENGRILTNLASLVRSGAEVVARIPMIPGYNDSWEDAEAFSVLLAHLGIRRADLLPFHQLGEKKYHSLGMAYKLEGVKPLRAEALEPYRDAFTRRGIDARL